MKIKEITETTTAGAIATMNTPASKKRRSDVGSLFGGTYKQKKKTKKEK